MIDFTKFKFRPVIDLPKEYEVFDFTAGYNPDRFMKSQYGIGRYNEKRKNVYVTDLFTVDRRDIHMGIDIAAPAGTEVRAFYDGTIFKQGYNPASGDYGYTIVTRHILDNVELFALHGHLNRRSIELRAEGDAFNAGNILAYLGAKNENGGWNPHLHFQLSFEQPATYDMPGVVNERDHEVALKRFPDPRRVLGNLYPD